MDEVNENGHCSGSKGRPGRRRTGRPHRSRAGVAAAAEAAPEPAPGPGGPSERPWSAARCQPAQARGGHPELPN